MTTLSEHPRQQLQIIIARFGDSICDNPKRCEAILRDLCPENKREVNLLVAALKEKVAYDLFNRPALMPIEATLKNLSQRLQDNHGTAEAFAYWAVESWALSLNVIQQTFLKETIQLSEKTSPTKNVTSSLLQQHHNSEFIVHKGIATETTTGLMWLRFAHGQTWENGKVVGIHEKSKWYTAFKIAKSFNQQGGYGDYTDWRLPTIDELRTLINKDKGKSGNYIDEEVFPNNYRWFWSSSPLTGNNEYAWFLNLYDGDVRCMFINAYSAVRLVRSG